jgi:hypothetical protein
MTRGAVTPHDILGVSTSATLQEIKQAYHKGALKYHPDSFHQSPIQAEEKFRELARAYKAALRAHLPEFEENDGARPYSPAEFARMNTQWRRDHATAHYEAENASQWSTDNNTKIRSVATVDENRVFIMVWAAATILGVALVLSVVLLGLVGDLEDGMDISDILAGEITALSIVALVIAAAIYGIILTRKTILLTLQLGVRLLPFLPKPRKPKQLTQESARES